MRKTRVLAALLCVMMLVCAIPVMQVSAAGVKDADLMAAIGEVMDYDYAIPAQNTVNWAAINMDFSKNFVQPDTVTADAGITYDADGINFPAGDEGKAWSYMEIVNEKIYNNNTGWSPLCAYNHYAFRFKLEEGGSLKNYATRIWGTDNVGVDFTATPEKIEFLSNGYVVHNPDKTPVSYVPGTEWNDVLVKYILNDDGTVNIRMGYEIWMKKASETSFTKLGAGASFSPGPQWATDGMKFVGNGASVKCAVTAMPYTGTYYNSIEEFAGSNLIEDVSITLDASYVKDENVNEPAGTVYTDENGAILPGTISSWRDAWFYNPGKPINANIYTPLNGGVAYFKAKVPTDGTLIVQMNKPKADTGRTYITITPTKVQMDGVSGFVVGNFVPGNDWAEYIVQNNGENYELYAKYEGNNEKWFLVGTSNGYRSGRSHGYNFTGVGAGVCLKEVKVFADKSQFATDIEEIVGGPVATAYDLALNESYDVPLSYNEQNDVIGEHAVGLTADGIFTNEGWKGNKLIFLPKAGWTPLENAGDVMVVYFQAKVLDGTGLNVQGHTATGRLYMNIQADEMAYSNAGNRVIEHGLSAGNDWAEYLITQNSTGAGYCLYMKSETTTDDKWVRLITTTDVDASAGAYIGRGLTFSSDGQTLLKNVRVYSTYKSVADANTKPATATYAYFEENFDQAPDYKNFSGVGTTVADGNLVLTETYEEEAQAVIKNTAIPVGGYAEFRIKVGESQPTIYFYDGEKVFSIFNRISYGQVQSASSSLLYSATAGDTYRTWRVVRNANGTYSAYSKADDDTCWYAAQLNAAGKAVVNVPQFKLTGTLAYDESADGVTELDYLKIYGPAPADAVVTVYDGYGTKILADGDTVTCPEEIRINVKKTGAEQTLLITESEGGILKKVTPVTVAAGSDVFTTSYSTKVDSANIKIYLWNGLDNMNPVINPLTLKK